LSRRIFIDFSCLDYNIGRNQSDDDDDDEKRAVFEDLLATHHQDKIGTSECLEARRRL